MESLEHNCSNISPTICTNMLILGKDTFLVLISLMISTNLISSQILIFTLYNSISVASSSLIPKQSTVGLPLLV